MNKYTPFVARCVLRAASRAPTVSRQHVVRAVLATSGPQRLLATSSTSTNGNGTAANAAPRAPVHSTTSAGAFPDLSDAQVRLVSMKDYELREQQRALVRADSPEEADAVRRRRIIYRSKQRGWLEVDLLLGTWAMENADKLTTQEMDEYEILLEEETIDIFNYVSGKDALPPHLAGLGIVKKLQQYAFSAQINSPMKYAEVKAKANLT